MFILEALYWRLEWSGSVKKVKSEASVNLLSRRENWSRNKDHRWRIQKRRGDCTKRVPKNPEIWRSMNISLWYFCVSHFNAFRVLG